MPFYAKDHFPIPTKDINSWTFDNPRYDPDDPIFIDAFNEKNSYSNRQAQKLIRQLVAGFKAIGLKKDECICIHSFNDIHYPLFFMGLIGAGGVFAGTNPGYTEHEFAHTLKTARAKYVLVMPDLLKTAVNASKTAGIPEKNIIIFNPNGEKAPAGYMQWKDLLTHGEQDWERFDDLETTKNSTAALLFSSGTTGLPKAGMLSHYNLIAQHTLVYESKPRPFKACRLLALPMFHAATAPLSFCTPLRAGEKAYVMPRFDLENWLKFVEKYKVTDLALVPPIAIAVINSPLSKKYSLKNIKQANCGAAPLDKRPQARIQELIGNEVPFTQVWGMTETSCVCSRFAYPETDTTGSVGRMLPDMDAKLVDDNGKDITDYEVRGELCVRGPLVIRGYFENPEANARDWDVDGYFHTGDIAYVDRKSELYYIVDRKKELIKVRGFQVAPPELEGVLLNHPDIVDAAVIGIQDDPVEGTELPRAYVVRREGNKPSEQEVNAYMKERLASYKQLMGGISFVSEIPKNASGKILKRILRDQAKKEIGPKL